MNRLDEALARLERAVARLEAAVIGSGGNQATSGPIGPGIETAAARPARVTRAGAAGTLVGEEMGVEGKGGE